MSVQNSQSVGQWGSQVLVRITLLQQEVSNNRSQVRVDGRLYNGGTVATNRNGIPWSIGGQNSDSGTANFSVPAKTTIDWISRTFWVTHAADGSKYVSYSFAFGPTGSQTFGTGGSVSVGWQLPTIPRASQSTFSAGTSFDVGTSVTIDTNRAVSTFTHTLQLWEYGVGAEAPLDTIATGVGQTYTWNPVPLSLATYFPNSTSKQFFLRTLTYSGGTQIGTHDRLFTLTAPSSMIPTVSAVSAADQTTDVVNIVGRLVQNLSKIKLTVTAAGVQGSTISSRSTTLQGQTINQGTEILLTASGTVPVVGRATDSRGRQGSNNFSLSVLPYAAPAVTAFQARRSSSGGALQDEGVHLRIDLAGSIQSLINSTQRNALTIVVRTKPRGSSTWTTRNTITPGTLTYNNFFVVGGGGIYSTTVAWDVQVQFQDKFGMYVAQTQVATIGVTLDLNDTLVGVGKIHEQGALDVGPGGIFDNGVRIEPPGIINIYAGATAPSGWLICDGAAVSRTTYASLFAAIGTTYGAGNGSSTFNLPNLKGRVPVGRDTGQSEFDSLGETGGAKTHTLTEAEMPSHNHSASTGSAGSHTHQSRGYYSNASGAVGQRMAISRYAISGDPLDNNSLQAAGAHTHTVSVGNKGGGGAHNNLQPYIALNYIIKAA